MSGAVTVKPLVWVPEDAICTRFKAEAIGGHMIIVELEPKTASGIYSVGFDLGGFCFKFVLVEYDDFPPRYTAPAKFDNLDAAKAAAQADYEARILSALTTQPADPLSDPRVVALVEALEWMEDYALAFPDLELIMEKAREALNAIGGEA